MLQIETKNAFKRCRRLIPATDRMSLDAAVGLGNVVIRSSHDYVTVIGEA